jgi:hypothetical protein
MLNSVVAQCVLSLTIRVFCETLSFRSADSAGRLASIVHSLGTAFFIQASRNYDSVATTLFALCTDSVLNVWYGKKSRFSDLLHHSAGIGLCVFSLWRGTWQPGHEWEPITMALVSMEMTNPIVHLTIVCHDEWKAGFAAAKIPLSILTLGAWLYYRIWRLGRVAFALWKMTPLNTYMNWYLYCVVVLCLMQVYWLGKLFNAAKKR